MSVEPPRERQAPNFAQLLRGNLRVLGYVALLVLLAYGTWRGLVWLFPEVEWLRVQEP